VRLRLDTAFARGGGANWTIDRARSTDVVAINAGQFLQTMPWGQVVLDGSQWLSAGRGPLSSTVLIDSSGHVILAHADAAAKHGVAWAFQSYPTLLRNGDVPLELQAAERGIDVEHRDARAAIGVQADGQVLVALTRFDALGSTLGFIPFGLTVPEMAAVMGALGARDAVMLDGGISGQLLLRDARGVPHTWRGSRNVPLALVGAPR
jgi:exopolysaccharide biosynthesis protein